MKIRIYACLLCIAFLLIPVSNLIGQERTNRPRKREHPPIPKVGTFAKDFSLKTADGETFKLSEHKGRIIILEFGACTWPPYLSKIPEMDQLAEDFKDRGVIFYNVYTREPHAGQNMSQRMRNTKEIQMTNTRPNKKKRSFDFSDKKQTRTHQERVDYALEMIKEHNQKRPILIDTFGPDCVQRTIGGGRPNSLVIIDREGKIALWQNWSNVEETRKKLEEMTGK